MTHMDAILLNGNNIAALVPWKAEARNGAIAATGELAIDAACSDLDMQFSTLMMRKHWPKGLASDTHGRHSAKW